MRLFAIFLGLIFVYSNLFAEPNNELVYKLKGSVAKVHVVTKFGGQGVGSGVVVAKDLVATNCHVIANATGVTIANAGNSYMPDALKADWKHDLCILRIAYLDATPVALGDSESLKYEEEIFAIGFPGGPPKPQASFGHIKALYPLDDSVVIRTDTSFVMGASGSPVFDADGKLVAISTFKSPGKGAYYYNIPVKWVKALLDTPETTSMKTNESPFWDAPENSRPYFMRVVLPYQNERWDELNKVALEWISKEPKSAEAFYYAGIATEKLGDLSKAKKYFQQALVLQPQHPASLLAIQCTEHASTKFEC